MRQSLLLLLSALVACAMANIYLTQPVVLLVQNDFRINMLQSSATVSVVILGLALASLPLSFWAEKIPTKNILLTGGIGLGCAGIVCYFTTNFWAFLTARFCQGLFVPCISTCIATYLSQNTPSHKLKITMGLYISSTVIGGLGGRLLCGWIFAPNWRNAFLTMAMLSLLLCTLAYLLLPNEQYEEKPVPPALKELLREDLLRIYICAGILFALFSSAFTYLPYRLHQAPFNLSTQELTSLYLFYTIGIVMGPTSGALSNRVGGGQTILMAVIALIAGFICSSLASFPSMICAVILLCIGFFGAHSTAVGLLNYKVKRGKGYANALYVLSYYLGGWLGITILGYTYELFGWKGMVNVSLVVLTYPLYTGYKERKNFRKKKKAGSLY